LKRSCILIETGVRLCFMRWTNSEAQLVGTYDSLLMAP